MVDVVHEGVKRLHPLLDAGRQTAPFGCRDDARHDIERDQPFRRLPIAIDSERNAGPAEQGFGLRPLLFQVVDFLGFKPLGDGAVRLAHASAEAIHLVEGFRHVGRSPSSCILN